MQELTGVVYFTSNQHKEATRAILEYLGDRNPFTSDVSLRNIETGVIAEPDVNVDKAENIGTRTLEMMKGEKFQF